MRKFFLIVDPHQAEGAETARQIGLAIPGAEVVVAESGAAAVEILEEQRIVPSLVFAESDLPDMSGLELLGAIRGKRWLERAPFAMLSARASDRQVVACYRLGACAFLAKPAKAYELREAIRDFAGPATLMQSARIVPPTRTGERVSAA